jgi:hypothetical protein
MRIVLFIIGLLFISVSAFAVSPTSAVFSITSTNITSTANVRVTKMVGRTLSHDTKTDAIQSFVWRKSMTSNYFLTKETVYDLTGVFAIWVQVDQATHIKLDSETDYMILPNNFNGPLYFE